MIVQVTLTRDELFLIKEMLPQWQKYADAFVFMVDRSVDGTYEFLMENKEKYNILSVLQTNWEMDGLTVETDERQRLYDEAFKHSGKIICLDTDEYIDGNVTKEQLEDILEANKNTVFKAPWIQYTSKDTHRVDGPWRNNYHERIGSYQQRGKFKQAVRHSEHIPSSDNSLAFNYPDLFIAHLQWLDKKTVGVKQYYWKISDYVAQREHGAEIISSACYDDSVNNFNWEYSSIDFPLKVNENVYGKNNLEDSFKYKYIMEYIKKYDIPNMNDWGMGIHSGEIFK
tara:strand:+ start:4376 stop:5227 length:852 start_codon:yes stop_codon:yes gene_type:complete